MALRMLASVMQTIMHTSLSAIKRLVWAGLMLAVFMSLQGCSSLMPSWASRTPKLVIPDCDSAKDQYTYASMFQQSQVPALKPENRREQLLKFEQCYAKVKDNFPEDQVYTPMACLDIADCVATRGDLKKAISLYNDAIRRYPENESAAARALFSVGRVLDLQGKYDQSKKVYRELIDKHKDSQLAFVHDIVQSAESAYYAPREMNGPKKPKNPDLR